MIKLTFLFFLILLGVHLVQMSFSAFVHKYSVYKYLIFIYFTESFILFHKYDIHVK